ncbi:hypothetical protein M513_12402 [Trichuris suis]|uniref:Uncharacterized protein n=1 Tax=Trichuris suis TaxID=68888 RepID=A0A085LNZ6_9BILA|nr:hypothetical protein M513_12402 [Trichuris suis]
MHMGNCLLPGARMKPYFRYSVLYCRVFLLGLFIADVEELPRESATVWSIPRSCAEESIAEKGRGIMMTVRKGTTMANDTFPGLRSLRSFSRRRACLYTPLQVFCRWITATNPHRSQPEVFDR